MPVNSPRVSMVQEGGTVAFVRDGTKYDGGLFGGQVEEAVRGNRAAEEQAREYKNRTMGGLALLLLGAIGLFGGADLTLQETPGGTAKYGVGGPVAMGAGLVAYAIGLGLLLSAPPHLFDAINIYNDGLLPKP
jgi:hypothetical protein